MVIADRNLQGNATFVNFAENFNLGKLEIEDLVLRPGINRVNITAKMDQNQVLKLVMEKPYCEDGIIPFKLLGDSVVNHGQNISYFATALASANQTVPINIGKIVHQDVGLEIKCK